MSAIRAVIYARVSTDEQARGYSLQTQEESCRRYCAERGYEILGDFSDAHSGTELDRPGLNAVIDAVKAIRPDVVVLHDVDRLGREIIVQAIAERELQRHGARIEYVLGGGNGNPSDELLKTVKQAIAVYENRQRVERSRRGKDGRVRAGHPLVAARPPYGYRYISGERTGRLEPNPLEAPIVRRIFRWCVEDGLTTYEIAKRLYDEQIPRRADTNAVVQTTNPHASWAPRTVSRILGNEVHKGVWHWNKTRRTKVVDGDRERYVQVTRPREEWLTLSIEPIVDVATWERAQSQLERNRSQARRNTKRDYLLRGLIFCPCGRRWIGRYKNYQDRAYYRCPATEAEPWRSLCSTRFGFEQSRLEGAVLETVKTFLCDADTRRTALSAERARVDAERTRANEDLATLDQALSRVERQLGKLLDDTLTEAFPLEQVQARSRTLSAERARLLAEKERSLVSLEEPMIDAETAITELVPMVEAAFAAATHEDLRRLLELLRVEIYVEDREHVRLTGLIGSVVSLSSA